MFVASNSKAPKIVAIILLIVSSVAVLCSLATICFSWVGLQVDMDFEHITRLQSACADTFGKQPNSVNTNACKTSTCAAYGSKNVQCHGDQFCKYSSRFSRRMLITCELCPHVISTRNGTAIGSSCYDITIREPAAMISCRQKCEANIGKMVQVCGVSQWDAGCSSEFFQNRLFWHTTGGAITATVSAIFILVTSIPVLLNGIFGIMRKDVASKISGSVSLGFAACSCCATFCCMISSLSYMTVAESIADSLTEAYTITASPCTPECKASVEARQEIDQGVKDYFNALTALNVALLFFAGIETLLAGFSFSLFKRRVFENERSEAASASGSNGNNEHDVHTPVVVQNAVVVDASGMVLQPAIPTPGGNKMSYPPVAVAVVPPPGTPTATAATVAVMPTSIPTITQIDSVHETAEPTPIPESPLAPATDAAVSAAIDAAMS